MNTNPVPLLPLRGILRAPRAFAVNSPAIPQISPLRRRTRAHPTHLPTQPQVNATRCNPMQPDATRCNPMQPRAPAQNEPILFGTAFARLARFRLALSRGEAMMPRDDRRRPDDRARDARPGAGRRREIPRQGVPAARQAPARRVRAGPRGQPHALLRPVRRAGPAVDVQPGDGLAPRHTAGVGAGQGPEAARLRPGVARVAVRGRAGVRPRPAPGRGRGARRGTQTARARPAAGGRRPRRPDARGRDAAPGPAAARRGSPRRRGRPAGPGTRCTAGGCTASSTCRSASRRRSS
jgi:hypothetical protein